MRVGTMGGKARRHGGPRGSPKLVSPLEFTDPEVHSSCLRRQTQEDAGWSPED